MLAERGSGVVMARARVAKEMKEKRAILERESMTESWSRRASRDENEESLGSESLGGPHPSNGGVVTYHLRSVWPRRSARRPHQQNGAELLSDYKLL